MLTLLRSFPEHYEEHWGIQKKSLIDILWHFFFFKESVGFCGKLRPKFIIRRKLVAPIFQQLPSILSVFEIFIIPRNCKAVLFVLSSFPIRIHAPCSKKRDELQRMTRAKDNN